MHDLSAFSCADNDNDRGSRVRVYVIEDVQRTDLVKVGISANPEDRCNALMSAYPACLRVLFVSKGYSRSVARNIEGAAHRALRAWALGHEWFDCGSDKALVAILNAESDCCADAIGDIV